jgi:hypothetical protein
MYSLADRFAVECAVQHTFCDTASKCTVLTNMAEVKAADSWYKIIHLRHPKTKLVLSTL